MNIDLVQTSCGFAVPFYEFKEDRKALLEWSDKKGEQGIASYWQEKNQQSIGGFATEILDNTTEKQD
jgi:hypothetical protein